MAKYCQKEKFDLGQNFVIKFALQNIKDEHYKKYLKDNSVAYGQKNMKHYKKYFLKEQDFKCNICGLPNV